MGKIQTGIFILILSSFGLNSCEKQSVTAPYTLEMTDFRPKPYGYTAPSCSFSLNTLTSPTDNFNELAFTNLTHKKIKNHHFIFTNANGDSLVITLLNLFNQNCSYSIVELSRWYNPEFIQLNCLGVNFIANKAGNPKMTGRFYNGVCNARFENNKIQFQFCDISTVYFPYFNSSTVQTTQVSMMLEIPYSDL